MVYDVKMWNYNVVMYKTLSNYQLRINVYKILYFIHNNNK